ncbi:hypothetical protein Gotri_006013, partial [Gossypium trilobum]|nr:hypothetical protein [Gossypium trilobum]
MSEMWSGRRRQHSCLPNVPYSERNMDQGTNEQCRGFCCGLWLSYYTKANQAPVGKYPNKKCRSASGLVVKNEEGRIVAAKSILHDNVASPFAAEAYAGYQATRLGIQMGYHILDIIGDSKTVITKCKNTNRDKSEIGAIISDIQSLKDYFQEVRFQFIPRVENTEAHRLAKETLKKEEEQYLEGGTLSLPRG